MKTIKYLQRTLQKIADETDHQILLKIKEMISSTIKEPEDHSLGSFFYFYLY